MFGIGFEKWDLLLIRFKQNSDELDVGYISNGENPQACLWDESRFDF